ncbi:MAG: hypothetical protein ACD_40C00169G0005 [uncultured bacterium]|nr:MAG: hypothetical protein ACD_40C00169G0005 [uncultured bacterium]
MNLHQIGEILQRPRWSPKELDEAARGKAIGSCADTPDIDLQFWVEIARDRAERNGEDVHAELTNLVSRALRGEFE